MFGLCGCCGTDSADDRAKEVPGQDTRQPVQQGELQRQRQILQPEQHQLPPSEGELAPEFSYPHDGFEGQDLGLSTSHVSMKTANYGGTLERSGTSSCSRKKSDDSGNIILYNRPPFVGNVVPAAVPTTTGGTKFPKQHDQPLSEAAMQRVPSSKSLNKINIADREDSQDTECSCPMYEVVIISEPPAAHREGSRRACIAMSTDDKPVFKVIATEKITRREYTYNVDLPEGMHISRRGKLVQDQGASVGDKLIDQPLCTTAAACRQSAYPSTSGPLKGHSSTDYHPQTFLQCCGQLKSGGGSASAVSRRYAGGPPHQQQRVLPATYAPQEQPVLSMQQPLSAATSKADKIAFKCTCEPEKVSASIRRASATKCKASTGLGLIQVEFECKRCRKSKLYLVCNACNKANKIQYCKDCRYLPNVKQDCAVYVKAVVSSNESISPGILSEEDPFCRDKYSKQNVVRSQTPLPMKFPAEQPHYYQAQPIVFNTKKEASRVKALAQAQDRNTFVTVRCRSRTRKVDDLSDAAHRIQQMQPPTCQALPASEQQPERLYCKPSQWPEIEEPIHARETQAATSTGIILDIELKRMLLKDARDERDNTAVMTTTTTSNQSSTKSSSVPTPKNESKSNSSKPSKNSSSRAKAVI